MTEPTAADIYREQRAHHGRMHDTMYAMPPSFAVVIGALWFFGAQQLDKAPFISTMVFIFALFVSQYLFRAYTIFATRTEEMRIRLQEKEKGEAFDHDEWQSRARRYEQPSRLLSGAWDFLRKQDEISEYRDEDAERVRQSEQKKKKGIQAKTREQFRLLMRGAGWLSLAGSVYSLLLTCRQVAFCLASGLSACLTVPNGDKPMHVVIDQPASQVPAPRHTTIPPARRLPSTISQMAPQAVNRTTS